MSLCKAAQYFMFVTVSNRNQAKRIKRMKATDLKNVEHTLFYEGPNSKIPEDVINQPNV
jgi:hypothetical protein